jgi:plasmid stabilization system protein ParE
LDEIIENIYKDSPQRAESYFHRLSEAIANLSSSPLMGIQCSAKKVQADCRILIVDNYLVFYHYTAQNQLVKILHIVYGNIQYQKLFN